MSKKVYAARLAAAMAVGAMAITGVSGVVNAQNMDAGTSKSTHNSNASPENTTLSYLSDSDDDYGYEDTEPVVTEVANGFVSASSKEAVNGSQLYLRDERLNSITNTISNMLSNYTATQDHIMTLFADTGALRSDVNALKIFSDNGWMVTAGGKYVKTVNPASNFLNFKGGDGIKVSANNGSVEIALDKSTLNTPKVSLMSVAQNDAGPVIPPVTEHTPAVTYDDAVATSITLSGENGTIIKNVAKGALLEGSREAVNAGQLYETNDKLNKLNVNYTKTQGQVVGALADIGINKFAIQDLQFGVKSLKQMQDNGYTIVSNGDVKNSFSLSTTNSLLTFKNGNGIDIKTDKDKNMITISAVAGAGTSGIPYSAGDGISISADNEISVNKGAVAKGNTGFVTGDAVNTALSGKVNQNDFDSLKTTVNGKASQQSVTDLTAEVGKKATQATVDSLTETVNGKADRTALDDTNKNVKANTDALATKADKKSVEDLTATVGTKADKTELSKKADLDFVNQGLEGKADLTAFNNLSSTVEGFRTSKADKTYVDKGLAAKVDKGYYSFVSGNGIKVTQDGGKVTISATGTGTGPVAPSQNYTAGKDISIDNEGQISVSPTGKVEKGNDGVVTGGAVADALSGKVDQNDFDSLKNTVDGKASQDSLNNLSDKVGTKADQAAVDSLTDKVNDKADQSALAETNKNVEANKTAIAGKADQAALDKTNDTVNGISGQVTTNTDDIKKINDRLDSQPDLTDVNKQVEQNKNDIKDLQNNKADKTELEATNKKVTENSNAINDLRNTKADKADVDAIKGQITANNTKVDALDKKVDGFDGRITGNSNDIKDLQNSKANTDASNIDADKWADKLGTGKVEAGNKNLVTGDTVNTALAGKANQSDLDKTNETVDKLDEKVDTFDGRITDNANDIKDLQNTKADKADLDKTNEAVSKNTQSIADLDKNKANADGSNIDGKEWGKKIATGDVAKDETAAVSGSKVYAALENKADVSYVDGIADELGNQMNVMNSRLTDDIKNAGAVASALAGLHPLDYDPDNKLNFAVANATYRGKNATALGGFYQFNENIMFSLASTIGADNNAWNVGLSFKVGKGGSGTYSRAALTNQVKQLKAEKEVMAEKMSSMNDEMAAMKAQIAYLMEHATLSDKVEKTIPEAQPSK